MLRIMFYHLFKSIFFIEKKTQLINNECTDSRTYMHTTVRAIISVRVVYVFDDEDE